MLCFSSEQPVETVAAVQVQAQVEAQVQAQVQAQARGAHAPGLNCTAVHTCCDCRTEAGSVWN